MDNDSGSVDAIQVDTENLLENGAIGGKVEISKSVENLSTDNRIKKRAKRSISRLLSGSKESGSPLNAHKVPSTTRSWKNTRRSRNGRNRGLPKKGECIK